MTLPNKIGYDVHAVAEKKKLVQAEQQKQALLQQQYQYEMSMRQSPMGVDSPQELKSKKRGRTQDKDAQRPMSRRAVKEEIAEIDSKFDQLINNHRLSFKKTRITRAGAENNGNYFTGNNEEEGNEDAETPTKRRKINDDQVVLESEELLDKITHLTELFLHANEKEKNRLVSYLTENREHILSLLVNPDDKQSTPADFEHIKQWVINNPLHGALYRLVSQMVPPRQFIPEEKQRPVALIEMGQDDILVVFLGKEGIAQEKEEVSQFLERFETLQSTYRQELEYINNSRDDWLSKFEATLREHAEVRYVSDDERQRVLYATKSKFDQLVHALQDKYLSQIFTLQESVLLRSKKRGNLPKHATNILKTWLFSNFLHPYPSEAEKLELSHQTQLTITQINNWFINARVRTWRPMLESMLEDKNKQNAMNSMNMSQSMMSNMQQQQQASRAPPHQTTSATANGSVFTTLPNFVQGGPMGQQQMQQQQQQSGHRYNTRSSSSKNQEGSFPHLWHAPDEGASPNHMDHYQGHYADDRFGGFQEGDGWHPEAHGK